MTYEEAHKYLEIMMSEYIKHRHECSAYLIEANGKAIEALNKQIPKKPLPDKRYFGVGKCPVCGVVFFNKDLITPFCGNCGQALDWSEE